jgi:ATP-binding cassette subfamily F protein uup
LDTLTALESYLEEFQGVLVVVSHDVYFTDKVTNHLFVFEGSGQIKDFVGTLSEYAEVLVDMEQGSYGQPSKVMDTDNKPVVKEDKKTRTEKRNLIKKLERDIEKIESDIPKLKQKKDALQLEMDRSVDKGWSVLAELSSQMSMIGDDIENKELRWLELSEQLETEASSVE